jgi:hypothetical protein
LVHFFILVHFFNFFSIMLHKVANSLNSLSELKFQNLGEVPLCVICCEVNKAIYTVSCEAKNGSHLVCSKCFADEKKCPCGFALDKAKATPALDKTKAVNDAVVRCHHNGCKWIGRLADMFIHIGRQTSRESKVPVCAFTRVYCIKGCGSTMHPSKIRSHSDKSCPVKSDKIPCENCQELICYKNIQPHLAGACAGISQCCKFCNQVTTSQNIGSHLLSCPYYQETLRKHIRDTECYMLSFEPNRFKRRKMEEMKEADQEEKDALMLLSLKLSSDSFDYGGNELFNSCLEFPDGKQEFVRRCDVYSHPPITFDELRVAGLYDVEHETGLFLPAIVTAKDEKTATISFLRTFRLKRFNYKIMKVKSPIRIGKHQMHLFRPVDTASRLEDTIPDPFCLEGPNRIVLVKPGKGKRWVYGKVVESVGAQLLVSFLENDQRRHRFFHTRDPTKICMLPLNVEVQSLPKPGNKRPR